MKKFSAIFLTVLMCVLFVACGKGVSLDENEAITGNGTTSVTKAGTTYTLTGGKVTAGDTVLYEFDNLINEKLFALGDYLYVNTTDGAMQLSINGGKKHKFGTGEILAAKGRWIYYKSDNSKVRGMSLYKVDMIEGRQILLFEDDIITTEEIKDGTFLFVSPEGTRYVNDINDDAALYYEEWATESVTE